MMFLHSSHQWMPDFITSSADIEKTASLRLRAEVTIRSHKKHQTRFWIHAAIAQKSNRQIEASLGRGQSPVIMIETARSK